MEVALEKIWKTVNSLEKADQHCTAMFYSIINLMIKQGIVTKQEATQQIEKSVFEVVQHHKAIAKAMREQRSDAQEKGKPTLLH